MKHLPFVYLQTQRYSYGDINTIATYRDVLPYHMCVGFISNDGQFVSPGNVHKAPQMLLRVHRATRVARIVEEESFSV